MIPSVPLRDILNYHGIGIDEYISWIGNGEFTEYLSALFRSAADADDTRIMRSLAQLSMSGDVKAIKLYFDLLRERDMISSCDGSETGGEIAELCREIWGGEHE